ncbi:MAG TPA: hypothetical protein VJY35_10995 [Candidatus Eisenbacteria bacterium]|nr:hypothetical protein [Candidatus Eisenbacteria bacterium]
MGIRAVPTPARPDPKATCPHCHRPLSVLKAGRCLYCGTEVHVPGAAARSIAEAVMTAQVAVALEPVAKGSSTGSRWLRRLIALGVTGTLIALFVAQCMRT